MICHDKYGRLLSFNDYVKVETDIGEHEGYINFIGNVHVRVNCSVGEFRVKPDKVILISRSKKN